MRVNWRFIGGLVFVAVWIFGIYIAFDEWWFRYGPVPRYKWEKHIVPADTTGWVEIAADSNAVLEYEERGGLSAQEYWERYEQK